ncbi:MAG: hypothetical protein ACW992_09085, partial [Candidatus Thorarchaeota archaeon]
MPDAIFVVQLDDLQGFIVQKRHPTSLVLTEKTLNLVFFEHQQGMDESLKLSDAEGIRIASYGNASYPGWFVCYVLGPEEDVEI